jgi:myo-inositol 2-dehydrogenase/D-chiro-inositol 1-dehydrogenase
MGEQHAWNLARYAAAAELVAVQDLDRGRAERLAATLGGGPGRPRVFGEALDLINCDDVEAVLVAAPDGLHAALALACIEAGKPALCEKPLATEPRDALAVLEAESASGRRLVSLGFQRRFDPSHAAVKEAADSGAIGKPLLWKGVHRNVKAPYDATGPFILVNSAGHDIDSARWLLEGEVREVAVQGLCSREELPPGSLDLLLLRMTMDDGRLAIAEIYMSASYGYEVSVELVGQLGTATTEQPARLCLRSKARRGFPVAADWTAPFQEAYLAELLAWVDSARDSVSGVEGAKPFAGASVWDGYAAMTVAAIAGRALLSGGSLDVGLVEKPPLYR